MKKLSLWLGLSLTPLILCACSQDWSGGLESARLKGGAEALTGTAMQSAASSSAIPDTSMAQGRRASAFAGYPDTGSLVHYAAEVAPRQTGAYTWHAAELSEEHAFRAVASGELTFESPDGTPIKLAYQRHVEHPDGNWSWIGEAADGQTAVITFGEEAVFGTIPQGNDQPPLRLTLSDGRAWVVSADKGLLGEIRNEATHPTSPDYLLPPRRVQASGNVMAEASASGATASAAPTIEAAAAGTTVIDVLVGYTGGFAAARGSQSAAVTRIRNLVDITNQAYVTSQINAELRLVHSMQVSFPDNTDNTDALEKLTGFRAPSTRTTPDPAFNALRQARETYGADLVALVRKFNDPENDGCGVAWLLGGGMSGINSRDEYFGYSVISDGQDAGTDGKTYFCREETFAHELGHNLGSQHDAEAADNEPGAFSYSYGYKTGSTQGNFYTIMAYGDSGQTGYRVFSNPNITTCGGRACGTASANNARSINNTASIIAGFRATKVAEPRVLDLYVVKRQGSSGSTEVHGLDGSDGFQSWVTHRATALAATGTGYSWVFQFADYDGDGIRDLYAINKKGASGKTEVHVLDGADGFGSFLLRRSTALHQTGSNNAWNFLLADYNGDSVIDLYVIKKAGATGKTEVHVMDGATSFQTFLLHVTTALHQTGEDASWDFDIGDYNGDGKPDLYTIKKAGSSGKTEIHVLDGAARFKSFSLHSLTALHTTGIDERWDFLVGDLESDGKLDVYAINKGGASGKTEVHVLNGANNYRSFSLHKATVLGNTYSSTSPTSTGWVFDLY